MKVVTHLLVSVIAATVSNTALHAAPITEGKALAVVQGLVPVGDIYLLSTLVGFSGGER
jgi:hypothetical protein